ncbi:hypothetical protein D6D02_08024 [Aureobasidium pullulans]|nr:hypothetical protein D6D02_08024 [Aureobasidium pullulans]THY62081.1 hypothetical protein D6C98_01714 [Aureobasidium pullulans]THZ30825.1 hypothetical protein D6C89_01284 [Aureobasidium pullulans]
MSKTYSDKDTRRTKSPEFQTGKKRPHGEATSRSPAPEDPDAKRVKTEPNIKEEKTPTEPEPPRAIGGGTLQLYDGEECYSVAVHEPLQERLTVNTKEHKQATERVQVLVQKAAEYMGKYADEDSELKSLAEWFNKNLIGPEIMLVLCVLMGKTGEGKTSTLNSLMSMNYLARAGAGRKSVTQTVQAFSHGDQAEKFLVTIFLRSKDDIQNMVRQSVEDLVKHFKHVQSEDNRSDESENEDEEPKEDPLGSEYLIKATAAQLVLRDLFCPEKQGDALEDMEDWAEKRGLLSTNNDETLDGPVDELIRLLEARAIATGFDLNAGTHMFTAETQGELDGKLRIFTHRQGFAPVVDIVDIKLFNAWTNHGIKVVDAPGTSDKNKYMTDHAEKYSKKCSTRIIISKMERCQSNDALDEILATARRDKGVATMCLVLTGREKLDESTEDWNAGEIAQLEVMKNDLKAISNSDTMAVQHQRDSIYKYKLDVNDRVLETYFGQRRYQDQHKKPMKVITISNTEYEKHIAPGHALGIPFLSISETRIPELRAWICEAPSDRQVRAFAIYVHELIRHCHRGKICLETPTAVRQVEATREYEKIAKMPVNSYLKDLDEAADSYHSELEKEQCPEKWWGKARKLIETWTSITGQRVGSVLKGSGRWTPPKKKMETEIPDTISFNGGLLKVAEFKVRNKESIIIEQLHKTEFKIAKALRAKLEQMGDSLVKQELIGSMNQSDFTSFIAEEGEACIRGIKADGLAFEKAIRIVIDNSLLDEAYHENCSSAFVTAMHELCNNAFKFWLSGSKKVLKNKWKKVPRGGINKARLRHVGDAVQRREGPFSVMADDIRDQVKSHNHKWSRKVQKRLDEMFKIIGKSLFSTFEGKRMLAEKRGKVAPILKRQMSEILRQLEKEFQPYLKHTL